MLLVIHGPDGVPVAHYQLTNAWPAKLEIASLQAGDTSGLLGRR